MQFKPCHHRKDNGESAWKRHSSWIEEGGHRRHFEWECSHCHRKMITDGTIPDFVWSERDSW